MLFSCSVEYRAFPSKPLFGQFLYGVLRSSLPSGVRSADGANLVGQPLEERCCRSQKRQNTVSAKNIINHDHRAKGTLTKEMPIEIRKIKGMAKPLKKLYLADLLSRSSLVRIGPQVAEVLKQEMQDTTDIVEISTKDLDAFVEGTVGWVSVRLIWTLEDGTEIPTRWTAVFHQEDDEWKMVQAHTSVGVPNEELFGR